MLKEKGSYLEWKNLLIDELDIAKHALILLIIPDNEIVTPPIPNFPKTVGSVEYQLVSLVSDAYPDTLLNNEGNRTVAYICEQPHSYLYLKDKCRVASNQEVKHGVHFTESTCFKGETVA
ncbi:hypothetical protein [Neobacillus drentensis]|uniref:hypothetical protein n=1 Tax=Neobacillus drentensis TaxID=220684 RepID=UPI002864DD0D|nr:hypothetical protein [Neobacillus drentensis]MDR7236526.1 hypothetical protein [Neobacillus drentensis]